jgi:hypothetical protein
MSQALKTVWLVLPIDPQRHSKIRSYLTRSHARRTNPVLLEIIQKLPSMRTVVQDIVAAQTTFNQVSLKTR